MRLFDTHAHIDLPRFGNPEEQRFAAIRARQAGIVAILVPAIEPATWPSLQSAIHALAASVEAVRFHTALGVHPQVVGDLPPEDDESLPERLAAALDADPGVVAIGECGLDHNRDFSPRPVQETWFKRQVELAIELRMPLFLHERDAAGAFLAVLDACAPPPERVVVHCFTGDGATLREYLRRGFYVGVTGWICDERRGKHLRALVREIPRDRLLVETDAPFLAPRDVRPRIERNEPRHLPHITRVIAECRGETPAALAAATTANARRVFAKMAAARP